MICSSQIEPVEELKKLALVERQSVLITGPSGCGKTYLAQRYADTLGIDDFLIISPKVAEVREALDSCSLIENRVMLCIENIDLGVAASAYTLLKSLEEPLPHIFIVVTCRNIQGVPDTIISRSAVVNVGPPTFNDIDAFGKETDTLKFNTINSRLVWKCAKSLSDVSSILKMTPAQVEYYESLAQVCQFKEPVSTVIWKISHYDSGEECNIELAIRAIMELMHNSFITKCGIDCLNDITKGRVAQHAALAKFIFNAKYCE